MISKEQMIDWFKTEIKKLEEHITVLKTFSKEKGYFICFGDETYLEITGEKYSLKKIESVSDLPQIFQTVPSLSRVVFCRDPYTGGHCIAVPTPIAIDEWCDIKMNEIKHKISYLKSYLEETK